MRKGFISAEVILIISVGIILFIASSDESSGPKDTNTTREVLLAEAIQKSHSLEQKVEVLEAKLKGCLAIPREIKEVVTECPETAIYGTGY